MYQNKQINLQQLYIVNTQSSNSKNEIWNVVDIRKPEIIVISETWILLEEEEVCLVRIKEQVSEKRSTVCTHGYADCMLKNTSTKYSKYGVNQKHEHVDDIIFRELFGRIRGCFFLNKICPFLTQGICIYVFHSFLWNSWTNSFNLSFSLEWEILV